MGEERRVYGRVTLSYPAVLVVDGTRHSATMVDLSQTGAQLALSRAVLRPGEKAELELEPPEGGTAVTLRCEAVHTTEKEAFVRVGVRFASAPQEQQQQVRQVLGALLETAGGGARRFPRVSRRIEITLGTAEQVRAVMCDLSQGGLGLESPEPLSVDETITVVVELPGFPKPLQLHGTVVHASEVEEGRYHAGVRFEELAPERSGVLRDVIQFLVSEPEPEQS